MFTQHQSKKSGPSHLTILLVSCFLIFTASSNGFCEILYVKPSAEVPIRSGQGNEYKILSIVPDGVKVELLEEDAPWARILTEGGTEGWMLKRYLSPDKPLVKFVIDLEDKNELLEKKNTELNDKLNQITTAFSQSDKALEICQKERDELQQKFKTLQQDTADVMKIKKDMAATNQEIQEVRQTLIALEQENRDLRKNTALKWFSAGGLVLFVGWIIGMMTGRTRKRKSSLF